MILSILAVQTVSQVTRF